MTTELKCKSCGADLEYVGTDPAITCNYCGSVVIVPRALRKEHERTQKQEQQDRYGEIASEVITTARTTATRGCRTAILGVAISTMLIAGIAVFFLTRLKESEVTQAVSQIVSPSDVDVLLEFGGEGPGAGLFMRAAAIAVDGQDHVYVADYETGRIQVFDADDGDYITQWRVDSELTYVTAMAGGPGTELYVLLSHSNVLVYDGLTGEKHGELRYPDASGFEDVATGPDGSVYSFWWTFDDYLIRWAPDGKVDLLVQNAIGDVTGDSEMSGIVAVDGLGNIYVYGGFTGSVFRFSSTGTFQNRFGSQGDDEDQFISPSCIAVSPAGDIYLSDSWDIKVFGSDGRFLRNLDTSFYLTDMVFDYYGNLWGITSDSKVVKLALD